MTSPRAQGNSFASPAIHPICPKSPPSGGFESILPRLANDLDSDATHFVDCDMAILGADPLVYDRYREAVEKEYLPSLAHREYVAGRSAFLSEVIKSPRVFLSEYFHAQYDDQARANIRAELSRLAG
ncbi:MAG: hypothetical protein GY811_04895 [Myxococcales bacterium]|nr:hypothetical protein [Myxococcales bacterium]